MMARHNDITFQLLHRGTDIACQHPLFEGIRYNLVCDGVHSPPVGPYWWAGNPRLKAGDPLLPAGTWES